ncbi:hypothetical protein V7S43_009291 [Phytophthora oleae]|uniref:Reverse transcriptase zinc-binding domain-containing protein n=1 Tax=Phytophthora oleae TaxID=2107226 RepID=A0ABD3FFZ0_9STRA
MYMMYSIEHKEMGGRLAPERSDHERRCQYVSAHLPGLAASAANNPRSATRKPTQGEVLEIQADLDAIEAPPALPKEIHTFWGAFSWANNPWIPDSNAQHLASRKYDGIEDMPIEDLHIQRTGRTTYSVRVPPVPGGAAGHTVAKLERWAFASSPRVNVGDCLGKSPPLALRRPPQLRQEYFWQVVDMTSVMGWSADGEASIELEQQDNGVHWEVVDHHNARKDAKKLQRRPGEIIFEANPQIHGYPWAVKGSKANSKVIRELKQQPRLELRSNATPHLSKISDKLEAWTNKDMRVKGQQSQTPRNLWAHQNTITDFQIWVAYRLAVKQLNLYYPGREQQSACPQDPGCSETESSSSHIVWGCRRAQQFWRKWLEHWFGQEFTGAQVDSFRDHFAAREAPQVSDRLRERLSQYSGSSMQNLKARCEEFGGQCAAWQLRNQVVHEQKIWPAAKQLEYMWGSCFRHLREVARRESLRSQTRMEGLRLKLCLDCLDNISIERASPGFPKEPAPARWLKDTEPRFAKRLRLYKEVIN